jgi:ABC-type uncharacterized transport system substrate-binding protein
MRRRREFITLLGGAAVAWPLAASAQQPAMPIVGFVEGRSAGATVRQAAAFRKALSETGYADGQNVMVEYHWLDGQYDRLPALMADLVRRRVAVIVAFSNAPALAAKAATTTIPIVFGVGQDPVKMGLVASLARPGGNATGINFFNQEAVAKRLGLLHDLVPKAVRIAVLVNPANPSATEPTLRELPEAARALGLQIAVLRRPTAPSSWRRRPSRRPTANSSSRWRNDTGCQQFMAFGNSRRAAGSCPMVPTPPTRSGERRAMSTASCAERSRPKSRSSSRPSSSLSSI